MWDNPDGGSMTESCQDPPTPGGHISVGFRFPGCDFPAEAGVSGGQKLEGDEARVRPPGEGGEPEEVLAESGSGRYQGYQGDPNHRYKYRRIRGRGRKWHIVLAALCYQRILPSTELMPRTCEAQAKSRLVHGNATCPRFSRWCPSLHLCKSPFLADLSEGTSGDEGQASHLFHNVVRTPCSPSCTSRLFSLLRTRSESWRGRDISSKPARRGVGTTKRSEEHRGYRIGVTIFMTSSPRPQLSGLPRLGRPQHRGIAEFPAHMSLINILQSNDHPFTSPYNARGGVEFSIWKFDTDSNRAHRRAYFCLVRGRCLQRGERGGAVQISGRLRPR